jgi:DNA-binding NarL/FixJ family response regulator
MVKTQHWDMLLLDIGLPDLDGMEVLKRIKRDRPELPVLIFSGHAEDEYAMAALEAGAAGYLSKCSAPEEILAAIRRARTGERYLSPQLADKLLTGTRVRRHAHAGARNTLDRDWRALAPQPQDHQHLPLASHGKTQSRKQCRNHTLCTQAQA